MIYLSQMLGKTVENVDGVDLGIMSKIAIDQESKKCVIVTDSAEYLADKTVVDDVVTIACEQKTTARGAISVGKAVYDTTGKYLGDLVDFELTQTLRPIGITLDNGEKYAKGRLFATGDIVIVRKIAPPQSPKKREKKPQKTEADTTAEHAENDEAKPLVTGENEKRHTLRPSKKYGDFSFLLGKTVDKNITNFQGETMLKQGCAITADILRQAKISGKLIELCLHVQ